jgi:DNA invertase Pin-like site-specific DNA recombinase
LYEYVIAKYIRLSIEDAKSDSLSIENQRLILDKYIADMDIPGMTIMEFVDNGHSGTNFERPAVQELLDLVRQGKVNCIAVKDLSRFGRNMIETGYYIERIFPLYRTRFIAISDAFDSDEHKGDTGGMEVAFKFLIHEQYSRDLSQKIRSAAQERIRRGERIPKNCAYGYRKGTNGNLEIDESAAVTMRLIFALAAEGKSISQIAQRLYDEKCLTPAAYQNRKRPVMHSEDFNYVWERSAIRKILADEQYIGTYVGGKTTTIEIGSRARKKKPESEWVKIPNHHPAIIEQPLFDAVRKVISEKSKPAQKQEAGTVQSYYNVSNPLKGKVVCGCCGHIISLSSAKEASFQCRFTLSAAKIACHKLRISNSKLEEVVRESIKRHAKAVLDTDVCAGTSALCSPAIVEYEGRIEKLQDDKRQLYESIVMGGMSRDEYNLQKSVIEIEIKQLLRVHKAMLNENMKQAPGTAYIDAAKKALKANTLTKELVDLLIEKVLVYPDGKIEIIWKNNNIHGGGEKSCLTN